ncbi:family 43 glycosylhydrolase [Arthrobacter sp. HS15c]|uniref:family 43 glycosylhydrolase n=1 Tax=Arthrobacter sp. HS15c TaxID=3230279 RepID=UPI003465A4D3
MTTTPHAGTDGVATNPFLPLNEYIPDGEPHVFGDRVYLFGSRDSETGTTYCELDYVFYSAPVGDLSTWTSNGVNYRASQDPGYERGRRYMYAPDVVQGNDKRFYLYYCMSGDKGRGGYHGPISVAVADEPDGTYEYLGFVRNPDGSAYDEYVLFDPAVINDNGVIRLYYGMCYPFEDQPAFTRVLTRRVQAKMFNKTPAGIKAHGDSVQGAIAVRLDDDMLTVRSEPQRIIPTRTNGTSFEGHAFWEGSSIRKVDDTYYFVYSSFNSHELCYATSRNPDRDFVYRGVIVSNGDIGLEGRTARDRINQTGTNHGSIERIGNQWYVFYHRNTHGSIYRRQACAEPIRIEADGTIHQVPVSSSGLNNAPLPADQTYPAVTCSMLTNGRMRHGKARSKRFPKVTHDAADRFVGDVTSGTTVGFKAFAFAGPTQVAVTTRGTGSGLINVSTETGVAGSLTVSPSSRWRQESTVIELEGPNNLYFRFTGKGRLDILTVSFSETGIPQVQ